MIEDGIITASVSALIIVNFAYILKKAFSSDVMLDKVVALCQMLNVAPIDRSQLVNAAQLRPYDYEDAVQYLSALPYHPDVFKTPVPHRETMF